MFVGEFAFLGLTDFSLVFLLSSLKISRFLIRYRTWICVVCPVLITWECETKSKRFHDLLFSHI